MSNESSVALRSIGSLIRSVIEEQGDVDPGVIATEVVSRIDASLYATYLHELIVGRVSSETGYLRSKVTPPRTAMSTKQRLIRDEYWPAFLNQSIALPSGYKKLAEATVEDLRFLADMRRTQANDLLAKSSQFNALADLMERSKVKFLEELDQSAAKRILGAA